MIRDGERVRLLSRGGIDYSRRFPLIVEMRTAVLLASHGIPDFDGLHSGKYDEEVRLYAFDILALDGDDLRKLPLSLRKQQLARLPPAERDFRRPVRTG